MGRVVKASSTMADVGWFGGKIAEPSEDEY